MKHLYIATPTYDNSVSTGFCSSLAMTIAACTKAGIVVSGPDFKSGPYIDVNRNWLIHRFLKSDADKLLFIDADVGFDENAVVKCYESGLEFCGGAYPKKEMVVESFPVKSRPGRYGEYVEVEYLPGGFMMIRRSVFEKLSEHVVHCPYESPDGDKVAIYCDNQYSNSGFTGEDVSLCARWRMSGGKIWCLPDIDFEHQGPKAWKGNYASYLARNPDAVIVTLKSAA